MGRNAEAEDEDEREEILVRKMNEELKECQMDNKVFK